MTGVDKIITGLNNADKDGASTKDRDFWVSNVERVGGSEEHFYTEWRALPSRVMEVNTWLQWEIADTLEVIGLTGFLHRHDDSLCQGFFT